MSCHILKFVGITNAQLRGLLEFIDSRTNCGKRKMYARETAKRDDSGDWQLGTYRFQHVRLLNSKRCDNGTLTVECFVAHHYEPAPEVNPLKNSSVPYFWVTEVDDKFKQLPVPRDVIVGLYDSLSLFHG